MGFKERTTKPEKGNKYYITKESGGYSPCIKGKMKSTGKPDSDCDTLPNCVGYAWGRFHEIGEDKDFTYWCHGNAEDIFIKANKKLERSDKPKLGALMCFKSGNTETSGDGAGHILVVEKVINNDEIILSDSGYNTNDPFRYTQRKRGSGNWGLSSKYQFQGFIYNPFVKDKFVGWYTVQKNDTMWGIAQKFETTYQRLAAFNQIRNPEIIHTGQKIYIPEEIEYTIQRNDTLWALQVKYGTSYTIIANYNNIPDPSIIHTGTKIIIPKKG